MARALLLLAFAALALTSCGAAAQSSSPDAAANCTVSTLVSLDASYTFNEDDYIYVDGNFDQFDTCGQATNLVWTVNGVSDYGRYFYEPAASLGPGTYAGQLDVYLYADWSSDNATLAASYPFNVTVLNQTAPSPDAPSQSGSSGCIPSPTVVLESNYVYGAADYIYIDGDFSYFRMCDSTATLTWFVTNADNATAYNTTGWSFFAYPDTFAPGDYQATLQVFLGDATVPASETAFGLTIVNGSVPTDAPATEAPSSGSAGQCYPSPTVLLQPDYYFDVTSEVSIYGDYYYFQACEQTVSLVWAVGAQNATGYGFWEPADTYAIGSYPGSLSVYFGDSGNETLVASYSFTVTIGNETAPVTDAPYTDAPWTDAPPAPCQPDYSVFLSENYWFAQTEDIVINPDLDFFQTCGADYSLNWAVNGVRSTGLSFFEAAGALALGEYEGSLDVVVNGSSVNTQSFNVTVYDGNSTALAAVAKVDRARAVSVLAAKLGAKKRLAKLPERHRKLAHGHKTGCCPKKLAARMQLQYSATTASTRVIRPDLRKMVGCGTHPALVWRVGRAAVSTGRQLTLRAGAFAPGAYLASLEIHSGRTVVKHTFVVVVTAAAQKGAAVSAAAFKYHPEAKLQAHLLGASAQQQYTMKATSSGSSASKSTLIIAGAAGVSLVAVVAMGVALALRRRGAAPSRDAERQTLVQHA